jgi:outer membrane protein OmpA-like peptidoglycan-associated protein
MKTSKMGRTYARALITLVVAAAMVAGCSTTMVKPSGPTAARSKLTQLQSDPRLASRAPVAMKDAEVAVASAELPQRDAELAAHLNYIADRKVDTARELAETRYAEDQRLALRQQRDNVRLAARTREADAAISQAAAAQAEGASQKASADAARDDASLARSDAQQAHRDADQARDDASVAKAATANAEEQSAELLRQLDTLQAKMTDRGLVVTLGDVLFASGRAELRSSTNSHLDKLVAFLGKYPERSVTIEGHTDSVGSSQYNQDLSLRRANAVGAYLTSQGVVPGRIRTLGKGEAEPVAGNDSADGRQQNRRVEVIIGNQAVAQR